MACPDETIEQRNETMTAEPNARLDIGGNNPPEEEQFTNIELMQLRMAGDYEPLFKRASVLIDSASRMPDKIDDPETEAKVTDFVSYCTKNMKDLDGARVKEKAPVLAYERALDAVFNVSHDNVGKAKKKASAILSDYQREVARKKRQEEIDEAERKRKEAADIAAQAAQQAEAGQTKAADVTMQEAASVERQAVKHEAGANAKASELTRTTTTSGATSSLRTVWKVEVTKDSDLPKDLLWPFIKADAKQQALDAYLKTLAKPIEGQPISGARVFEHHETVVRG